MQIPLEEYNLTYCEDIEAALERFGREKDIFDTDRDYRNSVCMSFLQIGELTGHLTEDFREGTKDSVFWSRRKSGTTAWNVDRSRELRRKADFGSKDGGNWTDGEPTEMGAERPFPRCCAEGTFAQNRRFWS